MNKIPSKFRNNNIGYHYTKTQTAIENILFEGKLRLTPRQKSIDPIENSIGSFTYSSYGPTDTPKADMRSAKEMSNLLLNRLKYTKQLCFCLNNQDEEFNKYMVAPYEYYGFLKSRMWDQYGDNYKGICLAFDLDLIKFPNNFFAKKIEYVEYKTLVFNYNSIGLNRLFELGFENYYEEQKKNQVRKLFRKHKDYSGEDEFRVVSFSENDYDYISIRECLIGIIISNLDLNEYSWEILEKYSKEYNAELIYINWDNTGLQMNSKHEFSFIKEDYV